MGYCICTHLGDGYRTEEAMQLVEERDARHQARKPHHGHRNLSCAFILLNLMLVLSLFIMLDESRLRRGGGAAPCVTQYYVRMRTTERINELTVGNGNR